MAIATQGVHLRSSNNGRGDAERSAYVSASQVSCETSKSIAPLGAER